MLRYKMNIQHIKRIDELVFKKTDIVFCYLQDSVNCSDFKKCGATAFLVDVSQRLNCLIFARVLIDYGCEKVVAVVVISDGEIIDVYEENDIETKFNLSTYSTRIGKTALLINYDIYSKNIFYALDAVGVDLVIAFLKDDLIGDFKSRASNLPYIIVTETQMFSAKP